MPRHREAKKDAANGETRRGAVSMQRAVDIRMGEPTSEEGWYHMMKRQSYEARRRELKHLSTCRRRK